MDQIVSNMAGKRILVVGDVMLDEHIRGSCLGSARESRVAVVRRKEHSQAPGGAANVAANAAGLGAEVFIAGVIGADEQGKQLCQELSFRGIDSAGLFIDATRPTTTKSSVVCPDLRYRLDHESHAPLSDELQERLWRFIEERLPSVDACVLSDYGKGVVSSSLTTRLISRCSERGVPSIVDPKGLDYEKYRGATLLKPNHEEASFLLPHPIRTNEDAVAVGQMLMQRLGCAILLTRGAKGMSLFVPGSEALHLPSQAQYVKDETGAGDTVAATVAVALAAGASLPDASRLASRAAAIVVAVPGTTAVQAEDLFGPDSAWLIAPEGGASRFCEPFHEDGTPTTLTVTVSNSSTNLNGDSSGGFPCPAE